MRPQAPARVVRQRKLAKTTPQQVLREDELDDGEYNSLQSSSNFETGVEKSEEKARDIYLFSSHDYHMQKEPPLRMNSIYAVRPANIPIGIPSTGCISSKL
jgi:hypothetical protein